MVPRYTELYIPVLEVLSDVNKRDINTIIDDVANYLGLSEEDKLLTTRSGNQLRYRSNISWALTDLTQGGFIERSGRGIYIITISGLELLEERPNKPTRETLATKSDKFKDFLNRQGTRTKRKEASNLTNETKYEEAPLTKMEQSNVETKFSNFVSEKDGEINRNTDYVSLEELYQTLAVLKKANLSTNEIVARINQLEKVSIIERYASKIINDFTIIATEINSTEPIVVEFHQNKSMIVKIGDYHTSFDLQKKKSNAKSKKNEKNDNNDYNSETNSKKSSDTTESLIKNDIYTTTIKPSGVWFKQLDDNMFAICGNTKPHLSLLKSYGGIFTNHMRYGEVWVFMKSKREGLEKDLKEFIIPEPLSQKYEVASADENISLPKNISSNIVNNCSDKYQNLFSKYSQQLSTLRPFSFLGVSGPHKAILLIAIFFLIKTKRIVSPKIYFTDEIENQYNYYWNILIGGSPTLGAAFPFAHIGKDNFFQHNLIKDLRDYDKTWNKQIIKRYIQFTKMDNQLFELLENSNLNERLSSVLINKYCKSSTIKDNRHLNDSGNTLTGNQKDHFIKYLENSTSMKSGKPYSKNSINLYVGSFKNSIVREIIEEFNDHGEIFEVIDLDALQKIASRIDDAIEMKLIPTTQRVSINHYIKYIQSANLNKIY